MEPELNTGEDKKYKVKRISNSKVYTKEAIKQLLGLYYLVF